MKITEPYIFKFMSVDGTVFHLRCRTIGDGLFDRSLLLFLVLCPTVFAAESMLVTEAFKPNADVLHWTSQLFGVATIAATIIAQIAIVLTVLGLISSRLIKWGLIKTIYVPLFYIIPAGLYYLYALSQGSDMITSNFATIIITFLIICACFDALYGRYVAPYHSKYVSADQLKTFAKGAKDKTETSLQANETPDQVSVRNQGLRRLLPMLDGLTLRKNRRCVDAFDDQALWRKPCQ